jgi:uncharacterized protein
MDTLIFSISFSVVAAAAFFAAKLLDKRILVTFALLSAVYLGVDDFVTGLASAYSAIDFIGGSWNWTGKVLSIAFSALVIFAFKLSPQTVGLTFKQNHLKTALFALSLFIVWGACLGLLFKPEVANTETLFFQITMPGLAEEIAYRGIAPALLLGLVQRKSPLEGMPWVVILATSILFGIWHGLSYSNGNFGFDAMSALFPFIGSIAGGWLRFKTGSLVFPILAHSLANLAFHVAGNLIA